MEGLLSPNWWRSLSAKPKYGPCSPSARAPWPAVTSPPENCIATARCGCTRQEVVFSGDLDSLRRNKDDVKEVATGFECGVGTDRFANWEDGDRIEAFKMVTQRRKLTT